MLTLSEVHAIVWALVQGARRVIELDDRLDTSFDAILYSMLDAGHCDIFDAILDAVFTEEGRANQTTVFNPGLEI